MHYLFRYLPNLAEITEYVHRIAYVISDDYQWTIPTGHMAIKNGRTAMSDEVE